MILISAAREGDRQGNRQYLPTPGPPLGSNRVLVGSQRVRYSSVEGGKRMAMRRPEPPVPLTLQGLGAKLDRMAAAQATDGVKLDQLVTDQATHTDLLRRLATIQEQQADLLAGQARQLDEHTEQLAKLDRVQDTQVELLRELVRAVQDMRQSFQG